MTIGSNPMDDYNRLVETVLREYQREVEHRVGHELALALAAMAAGETVEIPVIGGKWPPQEHRGGLQERVVRALCCQKWVGFEVGRWAPPLPLRWEDCVKLFNPPYQPYERLGLFGQ